MTTTSTSPRQQLLEDGYCLFRGILDPAMVADLNAHVEQRLAEQHPEAARRFRYQGSSLLLNPFDPLIARLITWPAALEAFATLGYDGVKYRSGYILSKAPHAPALYWHQDWPHWDDPASAQADPPQVFFMYYLTDTTPENGCLRVIPGTHRRRIPFHDELPEAHATPTYEAPPDSVLFRRHPDEVDVPVEAGDLVIGDARVLHAAHANSKDTRRTCLTLWYHPQFEALTESLQAAIIQRDGQTIANLEPPPGFYETELGRRLRALVPAYTGNAEPAAWNRLPGRYLATDTPHGETPRNA